MNEDIIDLPEFLERVQDDKELLLELLDIYSADYLEKRKALTDALVKKDFEQIRNIAHSLKGASGNISAKPIRAIFSILEEKGKKDELTGVEPLLKDLDRLFAELTNHIPQLKQKLSK